MDVSENSGTPKSSILIGFSIINHPFWGTLIFGNTHIVDEFVLGKNPRGNPKHKLHGPDDVTVTAAQISSRG